MARTGRLSQARDGVYEYAGVKIRGRTLSRHQRKQQQRQQCSANAGDRWVVRHGCGTTSNAYSPLIQHTGGPLADRPNRHDQQRLAMGRYALLQTELTGYRIQPIEDRGCDEERRYLRYFFELAPTLFGGDLRRAITLVPGYCFRHNSIWHAAIAAGKAMMIGLQNSGSWAANGDDVEYVLRRCNLAIAASRNGIAGDETVDLEVAFLTTAVLLPVQDYLRSPTSLWSVLLGILRSLFSHLSIKFSNSELAREIWKWPWNSYAIVYRSPYVLGHVLYQGYLKYSRGSRKIDNLALLVVEFNICNSGQGCGGDSVIGFNFEVRSR